MTDIKEFINWMRENEKSENTIYMYSHQVERYFQKYESITKADLIGFKQELLMSHSPKTVNLYLSSINCYMKFKGIEEIQVKKVRVQKASYVQNVITLDEYKHLIKCLEDDGKRDIEARFKILAMTGARVSEAIRITKRDLDQGFAELWTKGKIRTIHIPVKLREDIADVYKDYGDDELLFKNKWNARITSGGVSEMCRRYAKKYNLPREHMHRHAFRHFFAIQFLKNNNNISLLADMLGHSGINTTMIYLRQSKEEQNRQINEAVNW